jgi:hypothetical protein
MRQLERTILHLSWLLFAQGVELRRVRLVRVPQKLQHFRALAVFIAPHSQGGGLLLARQL